MSLKCLRTMALSVATATLAAGCAVGPDFRTPAAPEVGRYTPAPLGTQTAATDAPQGAAQHFRVGKDISAKWWTLYRSPALNALVENALQANPNLQSTLAALRAAKESVYAQQGKYFPVVQASYSPSRQKTSSFLAPVPSSNEQLFNLFTAQVAISYTLDVWGLNRRSVESLQAQADFQRFQVEAAYITLTTNLVVAAIQEASLRAQIDATREMITANRKALDILRNQFNAGYANRTDVAAQEAALAQAEATLPPLQKQLAVQRDLLAALSGRFPSQGPRETFRLGGLRLPVEVPVSLPSTLVEQRPDVRAAEEQLHAASAQVGVAVANLLPNFTISANRGYTSTSMAQLISGPAVFWTVAGNATHTLFDGFTLWHQLHAADALYDQAAWNYRNTVIGAFQNVADVLQALKADADALKAARDFERAAKTSLDLARQQLELGNANILLLLTAQTTYQQAVIARVQAEANRLSDTAALFQALGGGWWNREGPPAPEQRLDVATGQPVPLAVKHD
jgi:NodT family efflux transporter outer membrane factor (OMF) lipoprotein